MIGKATGSQDWQQAGEQIKSDATDAIRTAAQNKPEADESTTTGKAEKLAEQACPVVGGGVGQTKE
jgi:hypothetical protein